MCTSYAGTCMRIHKSKHSKICIIVCKYDWSSQIKRNKIHFKYRWKQFLSFVYHLCTLSINNIAHVILGNNKENRKNTHRRYWTPNTQLPHMRKSPICAYEHHVIVGASDLSNFNLRSFKTVPDSLTWSHYRIPFSACVVVCVTFRPTVIPIYVPLVTIRLCFLPRLQFLLLCEFLFRVSL